MNKGCKPTETVGIDATLVTPHLKCFATSKLGIHNAQANSFTSEDTTSLDIQEEEELRWFNRPATIEGNGNLSF